MRYVDLWDSFVGKEEMYMRDGLHLSGKGAALVGQGGLSKKAQKLQADSGCKGIQ